MASQSVFAFLSLLLYTAAQNLPVGVDPPLAVTCGPSSANIVCIRRYASVMPYHFFRHRSPPDADVSFPATHVPNDTSFGLVGDADFLVFDRKRGLEVLGSNPTYDKVFTVSDAVHEAPVYVPSLNKLFLSNLAPPAGVLKPQIVIDLNNDPPTRYNYFSDPPVYAPNGGTFSNGLVVWGASGGNTSIGGIEQVPGITTLDPNTNKTEVLLNNYFGFYFNCIDDLIVDSSGAIWFTDPQYSWFNRLVQVPPQLKPATYRFDPKTGSVHMVDDTIIQPNGIDISPDGKHLYISDTGAITGTIYRGGPPGSPFNQTGPRAVYKYDIVDGGTNIANKRPIWYAQDWVPDGLKIAANGYVVTGTGRGVDVLDPYGVLILRIQTDYVVQNIAWVGQDLTEMWLVGQGGLSRVRPLRTGFFYTPNNLLIFLSFCTRYDGLLQVRIWQLVRRFRHCHAVRSNSHPPPGHFSALLNITDCQSFVFPGSKMLQRTHLSIQCLVECRKGCVDTLKNLFYLLPLQALLPSHDPHETKQLHSCRRLHNHSSIFWLLARPISHAAVDRLQPRQNLVPFACSPKTPCMACLLPVLRRQGPLEEFPPIEVADVPIEDVLRIVYLDCLAADLTVDLE